MKCPFYGSYVIYQYKLDELHQKTDDFFPIAIVMVEYLAQELCEGNDLRFYEEEEFYLVQ